MEPANTSQTQYESLEEKLLSSTNQETQRDLDRAFIWFLRIMAAAVIAITASMLMHDVYLMSVMSGLN